MNRYELDEKTMELYDKQNDFLYPLVRKICGCDYELLFRDFYGRYIVASKNNEIWEYDDVNKEYDYWYGKDIACGGYIIETIPATINNVYEYLKKSLPKDMIDEYFSCMSEYKKKGDQPFPQDYDWIACYAVTGGSEGHYVHVDIIKDGTRELLYLAKTFMGYDHACEIAAHLGKMLNA
jgi:hypothetical protein